jgi:hypothetical protein
LNFRNIIAFLIISIALLLDVLFSPVYSGENKLADPVSTVKDSFEIVDSNNNAKKTTGHKVIVYYFHRTVRCETCVEIEKLTLEAVNEAFEKELGSRTIEIKVINMEEDGNTHFSEEYKLSVQSVIVSDMSGSNERRWKNLDKIWDYVSDDEEFKEYIIDEVRAYL